MDSRMPGDNSYVNNFGYNASVCVMSSLENGVEIVFECMLVFADMTQEKDLNRKGI